MSVIINLYGTGVRCWLCEIPIFRYKQLKQVADFNDATLVDVIFDLDRLNRIGYSHWSNLFSLKEICGFNIKPANRIEIKKKTHVLTKFSTQEILGQNSLFDLYNRRTVELKIQIKSGFKYILVGQKEIGRYKYKIETDNFKIDKLCFSICKGINNEDNLVTLSYNNKNLRPMPDDTLIQSFFINYLGTTIG